jgi:hypothetical protein
MWWIFATAAILVLWAVSKSMVWAYLAGGIICLAVFRLLIKASSEVEELRHHNNNTPNEDW